jgi:hypothetical protein
VLQASTRQDIKQASVQIQRQHMTGNPITNNMQVNTDQQGNNIDGNDDNNNNNIN